MTEVKFGEIRTNSGGFRVPALTILFASMPSTYELPCLCVLTFAENEISKAPEHLQTSHLLVFYIFLDIRAGHRRRLTCLQGKQVSFMPIIQFPVQRCRREAKRR